MGYEAKILSIAKRIYNSFKFEQSEERIAITELTKAYKEKINGDYISKETIRNEYEDYAERIRYIDDNNFIQDETYHEYIAICDVLQNLLKGE